MAMEAAKNAQPAQSAPSEGQQVRKLKKGELLFAEGENSRAMYFVKSGMIRIFKKKGDSQIEIDTIRSGTILGELAFLDGNPRSASAEALTDCVLVEISGATFTQALARIPDWMKLLLKTIVGRLRTASTRIKQLEQASTAYDYDQDGKRSSHYVYLATHDALKVSTALLLVAARNGTKSEKGIEIRVGLLQRYANQIMGVPVAKITTFLDVLNQVKIVSMGNDESAGITLLDADFLEKVVSYINEENLMEPSKRHDISLRAFLIMGFISKHLSEFPADAKTGMSTVNLAVVKKKETGPTGKEPFRIEEFQELVKHGYATQASIKSADEVLTQIKADDFTTAFKLQRVVKAIESVNEQRNLKKK